MFVGRTELFYIIVLLLFFMIIGVLYLIFRAKAHFKEQFASVIDVQNSIPTGTQFLYKVDLSSMNIIVEKDYILRNIENIIALFPVSGDYCTLIDYSHQIHLCNISEASKSITKMRVNGIAADEYAVKIVNYCNELDPSMFKLYLLTSHGNIYIYDSEIRSDFTFVVPDFIPIPNIMDICVSNDTIYMLDNTGHIYDTNTRISSSNDEYLQIISNYRLDSNIMFALSVDGNIHQYDGATKSVLTTTSLPNPLNVKFICNGDYLAYLDGITNTLYYLDINTSSANFFSIGNVVDAYFSGYSKILIILNDGTVKRVSLSDTTIQDKLQTTPDNIFINSPLIASTFIEKTFVVSSTQSMMCSSTTTNPNCNICNETDLLSDEMCQLIYDILDSMIETGECS